MKPKFTIITLIFFTLILLSCTPTTPTPTSISLPFSLDTPPHTILPMGETIYHPEPQNPGGHPGIDFLWKRKVPILASASGIVTDILPSDGHQGLWDVGVVSGNFLISYTELSSYNPNLKKGSSVNQYDFIGYPSPVDDNQNYMIHWNFGTYGQQPIYPHRLCPLAYFDSASQDSIKRTWQNTIWEYKDQFPKICNGIYDINQEN